MKNMPLAFALATLLALLALPAQADEPVAVMAVTGQALLYVAPDQASVDVGVTSHAATTQQALQDNNRKMEQVLSALTSLGLAKDAMQTRQFQVQPLWSQRPRQPAADWQPHITGYQVSNSLTVTTSDLELVGDIIGSATTAGANRVNSVSFSLEDPRKHRDAAIKQATANAASDAKTLAGAAGQTIVRVVSLSLDNSNISPVMLRQESLMRSAMADSSAPPIQAGDVPVRASVSIRYEIE